MAQVKNYGLIGVGTEIQFGVQGPKLKGDADTDTFQVVTEGGSTLTTMEGANATSDNHFVTKAQLDELDENERAHTHSHTHLHSQYYPVLPLPTVGVYRKKKRGR